MDSRTIYSVQRLDLFAWCVRLLVGFRMHFKSLHFHSFILKVATSLDWDFKAFFGVTACVSFQTVVLHI